MKSISSFRNSKKNPKGEKNLTLRNSKKNPKKEIQKKYIFKMEIDFPLQIRNSKLISFPF